MKASTLNTLKRYTPGLLCFLMLICFASNSAQGQSNLSGYKDAVRQRLLVRIAGRYLHTISQGQIDVDSALRIASKIYGLSPLLVYNEEYSDGTATAGSQLLDAGNIKAARQLLMTLKGEDHLRLLLDLGNYLIFKPGNNEADLGEASKYVNEAVKLSKNKPGNWRIASLTLQANLLDQTGHTAESQNLFAEIASLCELSGNIRAASQAVLTAGELLPFGDPAKFIKFEKALSGFRSHNWKDKEIETLSDINIQHFITKRYDLAEKYLLIIIKLQNEIGFRHQQYPYDGLTFIAIRKGNLTTALSYSDKALANMTTKADSSFESFFYARRAILYNRFLRYGDAVVLFNKSLEKKTADTRLFWYKSFLVKAEDLMLLGQKKEALATLKETGAKFPPESYFEKMHYAYLLGDAYEELNKYDRAEENYKVFLAMADKFPPEFIQDEYPSAFFSIASFYRITGNNAKARELLERGKAAVPKLEMERAGIYYYNLFKIDSAEKKYVNAIANLQLSQQYTDSAFSYDQRKKVTELLVKYEAEKKDKNIKLLNSQKQLAQITAGQATRTKNITLVGIVLLLVIVGLLFSRYLTKQKNNKKLEANQLELDQKNVFLETLNTDQQKLLKEKEWLIKEVHHRVKNNLQMVTSLLYSQSVYLEDKAAKLAVNDSLRRMQAMSLIHQKLYQADETTTLIFMPEYIDDLVHYLQESFDSGNRITFKQAVDLIDLDISQAVPLGLIITEGVVNAIKYAFLNGQPGIVSIKLAHDGTDSLLLNVADNGCGFPPGTEKLERNSLGLDLMQGLARQLNGSFNIENNSGVQITVKFNVNK